MSGSQPPVLPGLKPTSASQPVRKSPIAERTLRRPTSAERKRSTSTDVSQSRRARASTTACIYEDTNWKGDVVIGDCTIVGPGCCGINTKGGSINIGSHNVLSEGVQIINKSQEMMEIGNYNMFETGAKVEAKNIGSYNLFGAQSYVMSGCVIGNGCVIGPQMQVIKNKRVSDSTIMAGENLIQTQKSFKRRNSVYVQKMVKLLTHQFKQMEKNKKRTNPSRRDGGRSGARGDGRHRSSTARSDGRARSDNKQGLSVPNPDGRRSVGVPEHKMNNSRLTPRLRSDRSSSKKHSSDLGSVPKGVK